MCSSIAHPSRADDNSYAPGVEPTWTLHFAAVGQGVHAVWTENNEVGMVPSDVSALCDAGNSSKRGQQSQIGRKGG